MCRSDVWQARKRTIIFVFFLGGGGASFGMCLHIVCFALPSPWNVVFVGGYSFLLSLLFLGGVEKGGVLTCSGLSAFLFSQCVLPQTLFSLGFRGVTGLLGGGARFLHTTRVYKQKRMKKRRRRIIIRRRRRTTIRRKIRRKIRRII